MYSHFESFLGFCLTQSHEIHLVAALHVAYPKRSIPCLLMLWQRQKPGHQQVWYWHNKPGYSAFSIRRVSSPSIGHHCNPFTLQWRHNGRYSVSNTSLAIVYSTVYSGTDQINHQSSASLAFVWGIHRRPVNSPHKWPVTRKIFPFDDVIMNYPMCRTICDFVITSCSEFCIVWYMEINFILNMISGRKPNSIG